MEVKINILNRGIKLSKQILDACGGDRLAGRILYNRGFKDPRTIRQMLCEGFYQPTRPEEFPDMEKAVRRINKAIDKGEKICVYGDYDVDGVTGVVTIVECLNTFTDSVIYHVPDRFTEGYGMNENVVRKLKQRRVSLIITCDCGISNVKEITIAKELGMDVILTDHHSVPDELPPADVILNPKLLDKEHRARNICGCAMAYFLCMALLESRGIGERAFEFLDLVALSTVADVVSLSDENRHLLKKALPVLFNTERLGLRMLLDLVGGNGKVDNEEDIAFGVAPRINAAGRMKTACIPVELFLCKEESKARDMVKEIDLLNMERKKVQQEIIEQANELVETQKKNKTVLVLFGEHWHHGIIGIAAGRICEVYKKPAILLSAKGDGDTLVGSARSIEEIDIYKLLDECSDKLAKFGGHPQAAGLSLDRKNLEDFTSKIESIAESRYHIKDIITVNVDMEFPISDITDDFYERIRALGPYGEGFEAPCLYARDVRVISDRRTEKDHHIMVLEDAAGGRISAVKWFGPAKSLEKKNFDIVYKVGRNKYNKEMNLQLIIEYMIEGSQKPKRMFDGNIVDERGAGIGNIEKRYPGAQLFYEGPKSMCKLNSTVDRYSIKECREIVFVSPPVNTAIFREIIALANPVTIVLNFSILPDYALEGFILSLLGIIKHVIKHQDGRGSIREISLKLCAEESIVRAALKFLKGSGMIDYSLSKDDQSLFIFKGEGPSGENLFAIKQNLSNALMEKKAYLQFILDAKLERFIEYLK